MDAKSPVKQRPQHRRNASSKSNILRSLVSPKSRPVSPQPGNDSSKRPSRSQTMPILSADHPPANGRGVLGERQSNVQSPPPSPSKAKKATPSKTKKSSTDTMVATKATDGPSSPQKSRSSTNLAAVFARMNRSSKDLSSDARPKDKENTTPPSSATAASETPIWAQFVTANTPASRPVSSSSSKASNNIHEEIARYTPREYSPGKQRNFFGAGCQHSVAPTLGKSRPQFMPASGGGSQVQCEEDGKPSSAENSTSEDGLSQDRTPFKRIQNGELELRSRADHHLERKASGSSAEQTLFKEKLNIVKRGGRVMAAVAALQGKGKEQTPTREEPVMDPKAIDEQFEAVLAAREIPEPMRQKMRALTLRVKMDFVKQDQGAHADLSNCHKTNPAGHPVNGSELTSSPTKTSDNEGLNAGEDITASSKRSRPRSRTFTFSKGDKRGEGSPTKKQRGQSKTRPISIHIPKEPSTPTPATPTTPTGSLGRKSALPAIPADYISYLKKTQDPTKVEVGRLHKLRILLRNETVAWVDSFISQAGMAEIVALLHRIMALEWREEHEDQLLHETLLCLKGLCTTERAMVELDRIADDLFPALLAMLFDEEKKGPAEYNTRTIIPTVLFNYLAAATSSSAATLQSRANRILTFLSEPPQPESSRPVDFVLGMRIPRPYKIWCREVSNVTKEVFWIFLHHLNVIPLPKPMSSHGPNQDPVERAQILESTYTTRHFPAPHPPVPAAPYIGGVEWDATTYLTSHLDLLNGLISSLPSAKDRNSLREELRASGFEKIMGATLRTCKEKFYSGVHDGLRAWVNAAVEDGWDTRHVREGPSEDEFPSPKKSPKKTADQGKKERAKPPKLELDLNLTGRETGQGLKSAGKVGDDDGWLD